MTATAKWKENKNTLCVCVFGVSSEWGDDAEGRNQTNIDAVADAMGQLQRGGCDGITLHWATGLHSKLVLVVRRHVCHRRANSNKRKGKQKQRWEERGCSWARLHCSACVCLGHPACLRANKQRRVPATSQQASQEKQTRERQATDRSHTQTNSHTRTQARSQSVRSGWVG